MDKSFYRVLILDVDSETLITLQHVLENAGIDTTITWDPREARQLLKNRRFDLVIVGDRPPELDAAAIFRDLSSQRSCPRLIVRGDLFEKDGDYFRKLGASCMAARQAPFEVLDVVTRTLATVPFRATSEKSKLAEAQFSSTAS